MTRSRPSGNLYAAAPALRRRSYALLDDGSEQFAEDTAKVFEVPFELVPFKVREPRKLVARPEPTA